MMTVNTMYQIPRVAAPLIGKIEYLGNRGNIVDSTDYDDEETLIQDIKDELHWGVPIMITLYRDENGNTISTNFINDLDCLPKGFRIVDEPTLVRI